MYFTERIRLFRVINPLITAYNSMQLTESIFKLPVRKELNRRKGRTIKGMIKKISFENVHYSYSYKSKTLRNISFSISAGDNVAFVGSSGAGKSTLLNLLIGFYKASKGVVKLNGYDINDYQMEEIHKHFGVVLQNPYLFNLTIRENIELGYIGSDEESIIQAAKLAEIHDDIMALPDGYDTLIDANANNLSSGQKQRIAIARALVGNPSILILDEITSNLDAATEAAINDCIKKLAEVKTIIWVTHRLNTVHSSSKLFVLHGGKIIESGMHNDMFQKHGMYKRLWERQNYLALNTQIQTVNPKLLFNIPLFNVLPESHYPVLAEHFILQDMPAGMTIFYTDELDDKIYIIISGSVLAKGKHIKGLIDSVYFGEDALLKNTRRTFTAVTTQPCTFLVLQQRRFQHLLELDGNIALSLLKLFSKKEIPGKF